MEQKQAIEELSRALRKDPLNKLLYCKRADLYLETENLEKALKDYTSATKLDPDDASILSDRAKVFEHKGDLKAAIKDLTAAIKRNPNEYAYYFGRARCYERLEDYKKALKDFNSAIELNSNESAIYYERGLTYEKLGMPEKARESIEQAKQADANKIELSKKAADTEVFVPATDPAANAIRHTVPVMVFPENKSFEELNWAIGDRVFARWKDLFWYSATILNTQRTVDSKEHLSSTYDYYHVLYDDGWQVMLPSIALRPITLEENDEVYVRPKAELGPVFAPALVKDMKDEVVDLEFFDGSTESNQLSRIRVWKCPIEADLDFKENDRVFCWDLDGCLYPAEIVDINADEIVVHMLFGGERLVTQEFISRNAINVGDKIECRWKGAPIYFPCKVLEKMGERILVHYEDDVKEWTTTRLARIPAKRVII